MAKILVKAANPNNPVNLGNGVFVTGKYGREVEETETVNLAIAQKRLVKLSESEYKKLNAELTQAREEKAKQKEADEKAKEKAEEKAEAKKKTTTRKKKDGEDGKTETGEDGTGEDGTGEDGTGEDGKTGTETGDKK